MYGEIFSKVHKFQIFDAFGRAKHISDEMRHKDRFGIGKFSRKRLSYTNTYRQNIRNLQSTHTGHLMPYVILSTLSHWSNSSKQQTQNFARESHKCLRPYHVENTGSRLITEVKQRRARLVLGWVTAWEYRVP